MYWPRETCAPTHPVTPALPGPLPPAPKYVFTKRPFSGLPGEPEVKGRPPTVVITKLVPFLLSVRDAAWFMHLLLHYSSNLFTCKFCGRFVGVTVSE